MGASPIPKSAERSARQYLAAPLNTLWRQPQPAASLAEADAEAVVAVATSGGRDSTALLHCVVRQARPLGLRVLALHVNHGLQAQADDWQSAVQAQAKRWGAEVAITRLTGAPVKGDSIEAWARRGRYDALAQMALQHQCRLVLLAHHRGDQAETWLLQALRGAGSAGLAAMPALAQRQGLSWARPWLQQPRAAIEAYVRRHRLSFVDDPSNSDTRLARNRLRLQVWPALLQAFSDAESVLAAAAAQSQQALALAEEIAAIDLQAAADATGLNIERWALLSAARQKNLLRAWMREQQVDAAPESLLKRLQVELHNCKLGRWPAKSGFLHLYRGQLQWRPVASAVAQAKVAEPPAQQIDLQTPGCHTLAAWCGHFEVCEVAQAERGVCPTQLRGLWARQRHGGEQFALGPKATARSLAKQFQARAVPPWQRHGPLLWTAAGQLLFVPGLGFNAVASSISGGLSLRWVPDAPNTVTVGPPAGHPSEARSAGG